jgi:small subunit ribosomal protein S17
MNKQRKTLEGTVLKNKMEKTVVVETKRKIKHPLVKKYYTVTKTYKAHDDNNECQVGDMVLIGETKPISKEKRWAVLKVINKAA